MREILFRGKQVDNGEWVYGFYVRIGKSHFIFTGKLKIVGLNVDFECYEVIPDTVGQFTGLTDKNGKKIFESDIVKTQLNACLLKMIDYTVVSFDGGAFGLLWKRCGLSGGVEQFTAFTSICNTEYEVVGNIYDNPELLEAD